MIRLLKPYLWQWNIIHAPKNCLIIASRRGGKTEAAKQRVIKALLEGKRVLWLAPAHKQVRSIYESLEKTLRQIVVRSLVNQRLILTTGGDFHLTGAKNYNDLRGDGWDLIVFDEFAMFEDHHAEGAWKVMKPALMERQGSIIILSTPKGFNHFFRLYEKYRSDPDWHVVKNDYRQSPHLTKKLIDEQRKELSAADFRQEIECEFVSPTGAIFDADDLRKIEFIDRMPPVFQRSFISLDPSLGKSIKSDWQASVFAGWLNDCLYVDCRCTRMPITHLVRYVRQFHEQYKSEGIVVETCCWQEVVADIFEQQYDGTGQPPPYVIHMDNSVKKETRIIRLSTLLRRGQLKILNNEGGRELYAELSDFGIRGSGHDDAIDALEMCYRAMILVEGEHPT